MEMLISLVCSDDGRGGFADVVVVERAPPQPDTAERVLIKAAFEGRGHPLTRVLLQP